MATTVNSIIVTAGVQWDMYNTAVGFTTTNVSSLTYSKTLTNGTGANGTADLLYAATYTIAGAGTQNVDVAGSLTDFFGNSIAMARVKFMMVKLASTTTATDISFGNHAAPLINWISAATSTVKIYNDGIFLIGGGGATQYAVTATTADGLKILNNDATNSATVNLVVVGSSA